MERQDLWYGTGADSLGTVPTCSKAGQFLFISAQTPCDLATGAVVRDLVDLGPETRGKIATGHHLVNAYFGPVMAQTWTIYENLSRILAQQGASLGDIVRQRIFLRDIRDVGWMERVMLSFFPVDKPATLILGVSDRGLHEDIRVWADFIALAPMKGGLRKEAVYLPKLAQVTAPYPQGVKTGQFLFFDGIRGLDPTTGHPVKSLDEVEPEARSSVGGQYVDAASEAMKCQFWLSYNGHIRRLLESQGSGLTQLLDVTGFWRRGMREPGEREYIREKLFRVASEAPPSTGFGIRNLCVMPGVEFITGGVALLPGKHKKRALRYSDTDRVGTYCGMTKAGPFWFTAGGIGIDLTRQQHVTSFADLPKGRGLLAHGRIDGKQGIMAKAWYIYEQVLDGVEAKADQVVHQTVYLRDAGDWPAVERVASQVFKGRIPATTVVPVDETAFSWRYHGFKQNREEGEEIEIQLWGYSSKE